LKGEDDGRQETTRSCTETKRSQGAARRTEGQLRSKRKAARDTRHGQEERHPLAALVRRWTMNASASAINRARTPINVIKFAIITT